jgi:hypothetical protein
MREYEYGRAAGLRFTARPSALVALPGLWVLVTLMALKQLRVGLRRACGIALAVVAGHWLLGMCHHLGHALAARLTGYPMTGIRLWGVIATSVYPADEPELPAAIHVRRALGGPIISAVLTLGLWALLRGTGPVQPALGWALRFLLLDNLVMYTAQVFVPMGINDGTTLRRWLPKLLSG